MMVYGGMCSFKFSWIGQGGAPIEAIDAAREAVAMLLREYHDALKRAGAVEHAAQMASTKAWYHSFVRTPGDGTVEVHTGTSADQVRQLMDQYIANHPQGPVTPSAMV
jgi:hypothetical protein